MSLPRYAEYKDSGMEWLGEVPAHWRLGRLSELCGFESGKAHEPFVDDSGDFICVNSRFVSTGGVSRKYCTRNFSPAKEGDILMVMSDLPNGRALAKAFLVEDGSPYAVNQRVCILSPRENSPRFMFYLLDRNPYFLRYDDGVSQTHLSNATFAKFNAFIPPLPEQSAIAAFLVRETGKIDALIAEQEKLLTLLAEKRQATISHAVTRGLNPNAPMKDSGVPWLGEAPAHWNVIPLKHLVSLKSGGTPSKENLDYWNGEVPWASARDLKSDTLGDTTEHITAVALASGVSTLLPAGVVLVVVRGMILARTFPVTETLVPMTINQDLKAVLPKVGLNGSFLAWLLRGTAGESLQRLDEAGHGTKALRMDAWTSMRLPVPPEPEQKEIVAYIVKRTGELDSLAGEAEHAIALLKERRSALIAAAVTGKIDVRQVA
ncbi:restriction endonuclease subunit S [Rhodanobacter ginsengiterrae]|uniref:restriction endonuclease subunit S n=1 Tax=Rhodanobacter ginsengiterrae TaxID=2008451 RepID=UPI003CE8876F